MKTQVSALNALATHLELESKNVRSHGGHRWTYDEEIEMLRSAAADMQRMHGALERAVKFFGAGLASAGFDPTNPQEREAARSIEYRLEEMRSVLSGSAAPSNGADKPSP
jgi:hypothetical protein